MSIFEYCRCDENIQEYGIFLLSWRLEASSGSGGGSAPNDLLDQRDQRLLDLAGIVDLTQDFNNTAKGLTIAIGVIDDLNTDHLTQFCLTLPFRRNQDVMANPVIFWRNNEYTIFIKESANYDFVCMQYYFDNLPLWATTPICS